MAIAAIIGLLCTCLAALLFPRPATVKNASLPPAGTAYLGVSTDLNRLPAFTQAAGADNAPVIYNFWTTPNGSFAPALAAVASHPDQIPMITWNLPFTGPPLTNARRSDYLFEQARLVQQFKRPVFIRLDWEMNATWNTQWNLPAVTPSTFIKSWTFVYLLFRLAASNAVFVWSPTTWPGPHNTPIKAWYPGDNVVDWIGVDAFPQSAPPNYLLNGPDGMNDIAAFADAHKKPLMVAEWAPDLPHPDTADAVNLMFDWADNHPQVRAIVYFDFATQGRDFTLADHPVGAATFRTRIRNNPRWLTASRLTHQANGAPGK